MDQTQIQSSLETLLGTYGWIIISGFVLLMVRSSIESSVEAFKIFVGNSLNTDDVIHFDGRPARVIRVGIFKTILFVYDIGCNDGKPFIKGGTKVAIQNDTIKDHIIEKPLPMLDLSKWDDCKSKEKE